MYSVFFFILFSLAVHRLTVLLHRESGPFTILDWVRHKFGVEVIRVEELNEHGKLVVTEYREGETQLAKLINCPYCLSFWIVLLLGLVAQQRPPLYEEVFLCLAVWDVTYWLFRLEEA